MRKKHADTTYIPALTQCLALSNIIALIDVVSNAAFGFALFLIEISCVQSGFGEVLD